MMNHDDFFGVDCRSVVNVDIRVIEQGGHKRAVPPGRILPS